MKIALITGASSGLGKEFTLQLQNDPNIDEFWIVARRRERLEELKAQCRKPVRIFAQDLAGKPGVDALAAALADERPIVHMLIVAAGLGTVGDIQQVSRVQNDAMIDLNCRAAVDVTTICLPYLRRGSCILEVASIAAFQPMPGFAVYGASKAFLYRYTRALRTELKDAGIHVTCLCPYWIKDTEFIPKAETGGATRYAAKPMSTLKKDVVRIALRDVYKDRAVSTPGIVTSTQRVLGKIVPDAWLTSIMDVFSKMK